MSRFIERTVRSEQHAVRGATLWGAGRTRCDLRRRRAARHDHRQQSGITGRQIGKREALPIHDVANREDDLTIDYIVIHDTEGTYPVALDLVSRAEAFAALLPRLAQGYALDALDAPESPADEDAAASFLHEAIAAPRVPTPTPGMGCGVSLGTPALIGSGLEHERELVQLAAFPTGGGHPSGPEARARIARPSRRRPR